MNWIKSIIHTTSGGIESVVGGLLNIGINGTQIEDEADFNDFLEHNKEFWDLVDDELIEQKKGGTKVIFYLADNEYLAENIANVKGALAYLKSFDTDKKFGDLSLETESVCEEDWANNWKQYFKPFCIGKKLLIKPSWENCENPENRTVLEIDPASSFGTGQHHTTRLCLELLEKSLCSGDKILDLGCGSGILSIGAMLLGAESAVAVDIEENAVQTAIENAEKNHINSEKYTAYCGNIISDKELSEKIEGSYDIITANIVADVLIAMKDFFARYLRKNGTLIISGIIEERMHEVTDAVESAGFSSQEYNIREGWAAVRLIKN